MEKTQSFLLDKVFDLISAIQQLEKQMDDIYKINYYLIRKYQDDLIKEFKIEHPETAESCVLWAKMFDPDTTSLADTLNILDITNKIRDEMKKEMPDPWYSYGIAQLTNKE